MRPLILLVLCAGCVDYESLSRGVVAVRDSAGVDLAQENTPDFAGTTVDLARATSPDSAQQEATDGGTVITSDLSPMGDMACSSPVTHSNGVGQTWTDCDPLGTYNYNQAYKACLATGSTTCSFYCSFNAVVSSGTGWHVWQFTGTYAGKVESGACPSSSSTVTWN